MANRAVRIPAMIPCPPPLTRGRNVSHHGAVGRRELYPFRYKDPITGKWVRARYRATLADIAARYATWEVTGPAVVTPGATIGFDPYRKVVPHAEWTRITEPAPDMEPALDDPDERALLRIFLRRYVTYCARRGRYAEMNGAAALLCRLRSGAPRSGVGIR